MPNYCHNELTIDCDSKTLEKILEYIVEKIDKSNKSEDKSFINYQQRRLIDFNNIVPYPEKYRLLDEEFSTLGSEEFKKKYGDVKDGYNQGGYNWCVVNWGTKWNASNTAWFSARHTLFFDTAWSPPIPVISELHKVFPEADFYLEYYEKGVGFIGGCEFVSEKNYDDEYHVEIEINTCSERRLLNKLGSALIRSGWKAGTVYNPWSTAYMGHKGG